MATKLRSIFGGESKSEEPMAMVTRDLLGGSSSSIETQELDLDLHVPSGWEKHLDLKSGKVYVQRYNSSGSPSVCEHKFHMNQVCPKLQDFNFCPSSSKVSLNPFDETSLDLKLVPPSLTSSSNYQSVCTLDKVKSALERIEKEPTRKRVSPFKSSYLSPPSASYSPASSSIRENQEEEIEEKLSSPVATGCPCCLSYVLILKHNPICPRCNSIVPFPLVKKPKIDLNTSI